MRLVEVGGRLLAADPIDFQFQLRHFLVSRCVPGLLYTSLIALTSGNNKSTHPQGCHDIGCDLICTRVQCNAPNGGKHMSSVNCCLDPFDPLGGYRLTFEYTGFGAVQMKPPSFILGKAVTTSHPTGRSSPM